MRGINKVILVGTLGRDPETKLFPNGGSITTFSIATTDAWNDKNTGERRENTEWHRIVLNNRLGEVAQQYLRKGSKVYIEGSLHTRQWKDPETGQDRSMTEIRGNNMQMLDSRQNNGGDWNGGGNMYGNQGGYGANQNYNQGGYGGQGGYQSQNQFGANQGGYGYQSQGQFGGQQGGYNQGYQNQGFQNQNTSFEAPTAPAPSAKPDADSAEVNDDLPF